MLANPCTGARWRDSPLGIHRGSGPGHKSHKGARWHLGQRGCSRPGRPSLLERAFDPRKAFKKGTGMLAPSPALAASDKPVRRRRGRSGPTRRAGLFDVLAAPGNSGLSFPRAPGRPNAASVVALAKPDHARTVPTSSPLSVHSVAVPSCAGSTAVQPPLPSADHSTS